MRKLITIISCVLVLICACQKPDNPEPAPSPMPTPPVVQKEIEIPTASQPFFSSGISFGSGEAIPGTGGSGSTTEQPQNQTVNFTAPVSWTATVAETKAVEWLTVEPNSGSAGYVTMKVTARPNSTYDDRAATVTIKSGDATASFTVRQSGKTRPVEVTGVSLDRSELVLTEGENTTLIATVSPENASDKTITWVSSNTSIVTVDASGKVTALSAGEAIIIAKAGEKTAECKVTVNTKQNPSPDPPTPEPPAPEPPAPEPPPTPSIVAVTSVTLNKTVLNLTEGDSETITVTVNPADATDKTVTWSSSNPSVASVDNNGKVTAIAAGEATITAKAGEKTATCSVKVSTRVIPVASIILNKTTLSLTEGESEVLSAVVGPENATDKAVTWSSSNPYVASVDYNGKVTAITAGEATITAQAGAQTAVCNVQVNVPAGGTEGVSEEIWK